MKWQRVSILIMLLPFTVLAQQPADAKVDRTPSFVENTHGFYDYVNFHPKQPLQVKKDTSFTVHVTMHIDTNGTGSVVRIEPEVAPSIYNQFVHIVNDAPQWTPALIKNEPVAHEVVFDFDVALNKAKSQIRIYEHWDQPATKNPNEFEFHIIERLADFPGGQKAFAKFFKDNIRYPELAKKKHTQGLVLVQTVIEKDGSFTDIKVIHDPGDGLAEEALRVLALSPKWLPYYAAQFKVRSQFVIPVRFSL